MSNIFGGRPDCSSSGETLDLIFGLWNVALMSLPHISPEPEKVVAQTANERVGAFVRRGFLALLEDDRPHWFQKPIGLPAGFNTFLFDESMWDGRAELYWQVMREVFPRGRFFTLLRHPCDVVLSFRRKFGVDERNTWASLGMLAHIMLHRNSLVGHAVDYEQLTNEREATLSRLMDFCGLDFDRRMLAAFATLHTHDDPAASSQATNFSWKYRWSELDPKCAEPRFVAPIRRLHERFGRELHLPFPEASGANATEAGGSTPEDELERMRLRIAALERQGAQREAIFHERFLEAQNRANTTYQRVERQLAELTALRRNPAVRLLRKSGLLRLSDRMFQAFN